MSATATATAEIKMPMDVASAITFEKDFTQRQPDYNDFDAIMFDIAGNKGVKHLVYRAYEYTANVETPISVTEHILFTRDSCDYAEKTGALVRMRFTLSSDSYGISHIREYVSRCRKAYENYRNNKLGDDVYYFDQKASSDSRYADAVVFVRRKFDTARSFRNIFFEDKDKIVKRVQHFLNKPEWYRERGIPHTLGLAIHGKPGCGKTSLIKALAGESGRHVFNIRMNEIKSKTQLDNLFHNPVIQVHNPETTTIEKFSVPINRRLYIIEDIDCMIDLVRERETLTKPELETKSHPKAVQKTSGAEQGMRKHPGGGWGRGGAERAERVLTPVWNDTDEDLRAYLDRTRQDEIADMKKEQEEAAAPEAADVITLDSLLAILDGTMEIPGRMLVITTNMIDKIDSAVRRPGRIDHIIEFKPATRKIAWELTCAFHDKKVDMKMFDDMHDHVVSPAVINQLLFQYMESIDDAVRAIVKASHAGAGESGHKKDGGRG